MTETYNTEIEPADVPDGHEVMVASSIGHTAPLEDVLDGPKEALTMCSLATDKMLVGALHSACNRTCSGNVWLGHYLKHLERAPPEIRQLIKSEPEDELFRFGNGGTQRSSSRIRVPIMVGNSLVCVWISVVQVPSLGLLLGRDFLDGIGTVLNFSRKLMRAEYLDGQSIQLRQLSAGHFALRLPPAHWPAPGPERWRRVGQDGVVELQCLGKDWIQRKLQGCSSRRTGTPRLSRTFCD